jgi:hypothetical protein
MTFAPFSSGSPAQPPIRNPALSRPFARLNHPDLISGHLYARRTQRRLSIAFRRRTFGPGQITVFDILASKVCPTTGPKVDQSVASIAWTTTCERQLSTNANWESRPFSDLHVPRNEAAKPPFEKPKGQSSKRRAPLCLHEVAHAGGGSSPCGDANLCGRAHLAKRCGDVGNLPNQQPPELLHTRLGQPNGRTENSQRPTTCSAPSRIGAAIATAP